MTTSVDLTEYRQPGRGRGLLDVFSWRYLLRLLVRQGTQTRYRNSVLGWTWSYVKPAAQFLVFYIVMGVFLQFHRDIENFAVYLFAGIVVVNFFNEAFGNATRSIVDNGALVKKIYLPRELFPIAAILVAFIHFLPQAAILLVVCILLGWVPSFAGIGATLLAIAIVAAIALGLGLFFGALNVAYRDAQNFVELIQLFSTWSVPVLYTWQMPEAQLPEWLFTVYMSNPLVVAVELFHEAMWRPTTSSAFPPPEDMLLHGGVAIAICIAALTLGQTVFRRFERRFAQEL
ncbi:ABC transporter permease [Aeromicrobium phragmitis]|uniref:Transport permease protein n=1 Tax=Aeromicrobium phragmitis TaxID=2478914 RepID=A0A3L8PP40_9ACTN|nr:ABC transporter permease [Aeromicrobium phragmitis]RLV56589.1 ABC transporter permease [Aeromicrobium phragmitis]